MLSTKKLFTKILDQLRLKTSESITLTSNFSSLSGGVWKVGKICFVNISVYVTGTFAQNDYYTLSNNFPKPKVNAALSVTTASNSGCRGAAAIVNTNGAAVVQSGNDFNLTNYTLYITGAYTLQ